MGERLSTQYRALLIGNAHFPGNLPDLDGPLADVEVMSGALTHSTVGLFRPEDVESLLDKDTRALRLKISEFLRSSQDGQVLLLYYSGHGELDEDCNLYLCASDTDPQHLEATSVTSDYLSMMAERVPERIPLIIVLDCCNSGAFKSGMSPVPEALWSTGRYVLTSSRARQLSHAAPVPGQASVFTHYLAEGLQHAPSTGHLTIDELNKYVHRRVTQTSRQVPQHKFSGGGTLVVARRSDAPVPSPPPPLPPLSEPEERDPHVLPLGWNPGSATGRDHRRRRRDATTVAAWIGAVAVVVSAVIALAPHLLSSEESHRAESPEVTAPPLPTPTCEGCKSGKTYQEEAANGGARTYRDPHALLGEGRRVSSLQKIDVLCKLYSPVPSSPNVGKYWYLVVSPPWNGHYYTVANSYLNGDSPDPNQGTHDTAVDLRVPDC